MLTLNNLQNAFEVVSAPSITPIVSIDGEHLERFQAVITSDVFAKHIEVEKELEDSLYPLSSGLENVLSSSRAIVKNNSKILAVRRTGLAALSITPLLIETFFGRLAGKAAETVSNLATDYLKDKHRIIVYDFDPYVMGAVLKEFDEKLGIKPKVK